MESGWQQITKAGLAGLAAGFALFLVLLFRCEPGFIFVVDHANLLFHEAGHPLIGFLSTRLEPYGGTLGQLVFPTVLAVSFWRKGEPLGLAAAGLWFSENLFNIARYVADATRMELPLVGGGDHDWNTILTRWNLLPWDSRIAAALRVIGWVGFCSSLVFVLWRAWVDREKLSVGTPISDRFTP